MLRRSRAVILAVCVVGVLFEAGPTDAATAPTPTPMSCVAGGLVLSTPGSYVLTGPGVTNCAEPVLVKITTSNVRLDLGGLVLDGVDATCSKGIDIAPPPLTTFTKISISHGTVSDCSTGINTSLATKSTVTRVTVESSFDGISGGSKSRFVQNVIKDSPHDALSVSDGNVVTRNIVTGSGHWGLFAGASNSITRNDISGGGDDAMFILGDKNVFSGNVVHDNAGDGICALGAFDVITKNFVSASAGVGIEANGDRNVISSNTVTGSGEQGIAAKGEIVTVSKNTVVDSFLSGIMIDPPALGGDTVTSTKVTSNTSVQSGKDGIELVDPLDLTTKTIVAKNSVMSNAEQGIDTTGARDPVGALKNTAVGNVGLPPCDSNLCPA